MAMVGLCTCTTTVGRGGSVISGQVWATQDAPFVLPLSSISTGTHLPVRYLLTTIRVQHTEY